jgi:hypothetical protein
MRNVPWIGLAALVAMFALPFLPDWIFEGPRTVRHRPRRHVCADCGASWSPDHECERPAPVAGPAPQGRPALRGELRRVGRSSGGYSVPNRWRRSTRVVEDQSGVIRVEPRRRALAPSETAEIIRRPPSSASSR